MEVKNREKGRILVVDDDINCILITTASLNSSRFEVTTVNNIEVALGGLRSSGLSFDLLLTDIHMLKMDVFQFQQEITKEFDIPICFMSNDEKDSTLIKVLENRAFFFTLKPITQDGITYLWNYATSLRKMKHTSKKVVQEFEENTNEKILNEVIHIESSSSVSKKNKSTRRYVNVENEEYPSQRAKRSKTLWLDPLHNKFVEIVDILGVKNASPKKVHELMNMPQLSKNQIASHLQKYRLGLDKNPSPESDLNSNKITSDNANQLSTTTDNISTLAPQLLTKNLNNADTDTDADLRNFMSDYEKDRFFFNILSRHLNQKPCKSQGNHEGINAKGISLQLGNVLPNSNSEQGNASITAEERPLNFNTVSPNLAPQQEIYGGVTAEETLFDHLDVPSNSEIGSGDNGNFTAEEWSFLDSLILDHELEQANHEGLTTKEGLLQLHNDAPNTTLEDDFLLCYDDTDLEPKQANQEGRTTKEGLLQLSNDPPNTTLEDDFLLCYDDLDLEPQKEQDKAINTDEEIPVHLHNAPSTKASEKEQGKAINTEEEIPVHLRNAPSTKASKKEKGKSIATAEERPVHKLKRPGNIEHLWTMNYYSYPSTAYRKNEGY